jgi:hypothetical protein
MELYIFRKYTKKSKKVKKQKSKKAKIIVRIDEAIEQENQQQLAFSSFLKKTKKVEHITLFSKDDLHER